MRIGIVSTWFERGAGMVSRAYRETLRRENEVFVYARAGEHYAQDDEVWNDSSVTWGKRVQGHSNTVVAWSEFQAWVTAHDLDLLIFNEQLYWPLVVLSRRHLPCKLVAYVDYYTQLTVPFFRLYDALLCNTRRHFSVFEEFPGAIYIPWGCDTGLFVADREPIESGCVTFFHSCGMSPVRKGTLTALKAFLGLRGNCRFFLHIQAPIETFPEIFEICRRDRRIEVVNKTVSAPGLYRQGDVYVYPTTLEGIGLTIAEALSSGLPVITPDVPPMNEFVRHGENGYLLRPYQYRSRHDAYYWATCHCRVELVRDAMQYYIDHMGDLPDYKRRARASAEERLNWQNNSLPLHQHLAEIIAADGVRPDLSSLEREALERSLVYTLHGRLLRKLVQLVPSMRSSLLDRFIYG